MTDTSLACHPQVAAPSDSLKSEEQVNAASTRAPRPVQEYPGSPCRTAPLPAGGYCVLGPDILNAAGEKQIFRGTNLPSLEWNTKGSYLSKHSYEFLANSGATIVRLPMNQAFWDEDPNYAMMIEQQVDLAERVGLHVILDLHRAPLPGNEVNEQQDMTHAGSVAFWKSIAKKYQDRPHVFFELYNEPRNISWQLWRDGGTHPSGWEVAGVQQLVDAIREEGAQNLILIGGLDWAYRLDGLKRFLIDGTNLVYVTHLYNYPSKVPERWENDWLFMASQAPVMITEVGPGPHSNNQVSDYARVALKLAEERHLSWMSWAFYPFDDNAMLEKSLDPSLEKFPLTSWGRFVVELWKQHAPLVSTGSPSASESSTAEAAIRE